MIMINHSQNLSKTYYFLRLLWNYNW